MELDLRQEHALHGLVGVARAILVVWWGLDEFAHEAESIGLLTRLQRDDVSERLPWPQDRVLPLSANEVTDGRKVIAVENQWLWEAVLEPNASAPTVEFLSEGDSPESRIPVASMPLDAFLVRVLTEAAIQSAEPQLEAQIDQDAAHSMIILDEFAADHSVLFRALVAGPGWFGSLSGSRLHVASRTAPLELASAFGHDWRQLVPVAGEPDEPFAFGLVGQWQRWMPLR